MYLPISPGGTGQAKAIEAIERIRCVEEIRAWIITDKLRLYDNKTEFLIIETKQELSKISPSSNSYARNLARMRMDTTLTFTKRVELLTFTLYNIRHIRKFLTKEATQILVHALLIS